MLLDSETLKKRLRYQGTQYQAGQAARGGGESVHMLTQAADRIEALERGLMNLRYGMKDTTNPNIVDYIDAVLEVPNHTIKN